MLWGTSIKLSIMDMYPIVSIIIPIYNRVQYLPAALDSVYAQDYTDYEIILVDDGSQDDIRSAVEQAHRQDKPAVRYVRQDNRGPAGARNRGIREAQGRLIAFHDSDDQWYPNFLSRTVPFLTSGEYDWVSTASMRIVVNEKGEEIRRHVILDQTCSDFQSLFFETIEFNVMGGPSQNILKKECFEKYGYFREDLRIRDDWEMWLRLLKAGCRVKEIPEPLYQYKIRADSITKTSMDQSLRNTFDVLRQYRDYALSLDPAFRHKYADLIWNIARHLKNRGIDDPELFWKCIIESIRVDFNIARMAKSFQSNLPNPIG